MKSHIDPIIFLPKHLKGEKHGKTASDVSLNKWLYASVCTWELGVVVAEERAPLAGRERTVHLIWMIKVAPACLTSHRI